MRRVCVCACKPSLAHRALTVDLDVSLLLPCKVLVYEEDRGAAVSLVDPQIMLGMITSPALEAIACEAREKLQRVAARESCCIASRRAAHAKGME